MALDVRLVDDVQPELVAEIEEARIVRVVRAPDGVDVVLLHQQQIGAHVVDGDGLAPLGMVIVAIHAPHHDAPPVDEQVAVAHLDRAEADDDAHCLDHRAVRIDQRHDHPVATGTLGRPWFDAGKLGAHIGDMTAEQVRAEIDGHGGDQHRTGAAAGQRLELRPDRPPCRDQLPVAERDRRADAERADRLGTGFGDRFDQPGVDAYVVDVHSGSCHERDLAVQATHPPLVLILDERMGGELHDDDGELVGAGAQVGGEVVLAGEPAVRAVADERTVEVDGVDALGAADVEHHLAPPPRSRDAERRPVDARRNPCREVGRQVRERHLHVRVVGEVVDALHGPVARARRRSAIRPRHRGIPAAATASGGTTSG